MISGRKRKHAFTIMALDAVLSMLPTGGADNTDDWNVVYEDRKTYIV